MKGVLCYELFGGIAHKNHILIHILSEACASYINVLSLRSF